MQFMKVINHDLKAQNVIILTGPMSIFLKAFFIEKSYVIDFDYIFPSPNSPSTPQPTYPIFHSTPHQTAKQRKQQN